MFLGSYKEYSSNVESVLYFHNSIFPMIKSKIPSVKFYVVGYGPTKEMMDILGQDKDAVITGYVNDIESYYKKVKVFVAPMLDHRWRCNNQNSCNVSELYQWFPQASVTRNWWYR